MFLKRLFLFLLWGALIQGCSSRPAPAPVVEVYQGKNIYDHQADSYHGEKYKVKKGDTLFSIAWFSGNDYRDLARINGIEPPYNIFPGQEISLKTPSNSIENTKPKKGGRTSQNIDTRPVDRSKKQAYGKSENFVNSPKKSRVANGFPSKVNSWQWPARGRVVGRFSDQQQGNKGLDIAANRGTAVVAAAKGKVVYTGDALRGYGNLIIIKHSDSYLSAYAHNDKILVREQNWVEAGQQIAAMGDSGTDKVKLHFEVRYKGKSVDPLRYLPTTQQQ